MRNPLSEDVCSPVETHDMVPPLQDNPQVQADSSVPECDGRPSVQSTEWSLHQQVFKQICQKWFIPHVDILATRLNQKVPLYVSLVQDQHAWDKDALNIVWSGLSACGYPPMSLLHMVIQNQANPLPHHCNNPRLARDALVLGPSSSSPRKSHPNYQCQ